MKTIVVFTPPKYHSEIWLPALWSQAKTYYEKHGKNTNRWRWYPCYADTQIDLGKIKAVLEEAQPDIFAISLYVWNVNLALAVAKWVKNRWPNCLIVSGGPHQNLKYNINWFKEHNYIDASLPGECYGELFFKELLDTYHNGSVDWNTITDARYPREQTRLLAVSRKTMQSADKKDFDYQWSSFAEQHEEIAKFINYQPNAKILAIVETTRGCPYGCTYCDWGGGILTSVRKKDLIHVEKDLKFLTSINLYHLYISDANMGIFGDRDLEIIRMLSKLRNENKQLFSIGYGGFAKTDKKLPTIREIIKIGLENDFDSGRNFKLSMQSLDFTVLKNIDRKNINLAAMIKTLTPLVKKYKKSFEVELILGLPGITLEKFYYEMDILNRFKLSGRWYEWLLLPEAPAYSPEYRTQYGIKTAIKNNGWAFAEPSAAMEIVVESHSYTKKDYLEMLLATSIYHAIIQGGLYIDSVNWIMKTHSVGLGQIIKEIHNQFYQDHFLHDWNSILNDPEKNCFFNVAGTHQVSVGLYFAAVAFVDPAFVEELKQFLHNKYNCPIKLLTQEQKNLSNITNSIQSLEKVIQEFNLYKQNILKKQNKLFGIFKMPW